MARYGLPDKVIYCKICVVSNQRPSSTVEHAYQPEETKHTIEFDADGVCSACRVADARKTIDWDERDRMLRDLCDQHRAKDGSFDIIIPGSGGKDSFMVAHKMIHDYGMHPLLVTWPPALYTQWGWANYTRWKELAPHMCYAPAGKTHRLLTRLATENLGHIFWSFVIGQKNLAPKIAKMTGIRLCMFGESEGLYGNKASETETPLRSESYYTASKEIFLGGVEMGELMSRYGVTKAELEPYLPIQDSPQIEVHYASFYMPWRPQSNYYYAVEHGGFEASPERVPGTYSKYAGVDDMADDHHFWLTFQKYGIGRATYDAAQEIRSGEITREEGVALVKRFDGEYPERFEREVNEYLSVEGFPPFTRDRWFMLAEKFRSPHLWDGDRLRHTVWE